MQRRLTPAAILGKHILNRLELISCYTNTGATEGDARYDQLLSESEPTILAQLRKHSALSRDEAAGLLQSVAGSELAPTSMVERLANLFLRITCIADDAGTELLAEIGTHKYVNVHSNFYCTKLDWSALEMAMGLLANYR